MVRRSSATSRGTTSWFCLLLFLLFSCDPGISSAHCQVFKILLLTIIKKKRKAIKETSSSIPGSTWLFPVEEKSAMSRSCKSALMCSATVWCPRRQLDRDRAETLNDIKTANKLIKFNGISSNSIKNDIITVYLAGNCIIFITHVWYHFWPINSQYFRVLSSTCGRL